MSEKAFAEALNKQIANELAAAQQYIAAAVYYDAETLPQLAGFFYRQALEERNHAMMMVQFLIDTDQKPVIPLKEQVEEVASMTDLLAVVERAKDDPLHGEEYLAREQIGDEGDDPSAPATAGGAL
jgi:ferritin